MKNKFVIIKGIVIAIVVVFVILILFMLSKVYQMVIVSRVFEAVAKFRDEENRMYLVNTIINENIILKEGTLLKEKTIKYVNEKDDSNVSYEWKNLQSNEAYFFNTNSKKVYKGDIVIAKRNILFNLPSLMGYISEDGKFDISKVFEIIYILPTRYEDKFCYKIITKNEVIIVEKNTYLPIYSSIKRMKSDEESKNIIERTYEFKVGEVTDEDVALPDLSEYTFVEN